LLTLRGDQNEPDYLKLNPNGVVPTLVHDGVPIGESSLSFYYIDEIFPDPPLMPKAALPRFRVRMYNKLVDEYVHNSCTILTFATAFGPISSNCRAKRGSPKSIRPAQAARRV
jgi:glutathione S-transferase